ncbi:MAG: universal stress protein [Nocardioides sp.]|uniref:universal stress protein n=1 Tax=Nocardioides sp. TaxID=35761 RepID=UPI0039E47950
MTLPEQHDQTPAEPSGGVGGADGPSDTVSDTVMVAVDGSEPSDVAARYAVDICRRSGSELAIAHVVTGYSGLVPTVVPGLEEAGQAVLDEAVTLARASLPADRVHGYLLHGQRQAALLELSHQARLVVLGFQQKSSVERLVTGSTITAISSAAACPVATIPKAWAGNDRGVVGVGIKTIDSAEPLLREALRIARLRESRLEIVHSWQLPTAAYEGLLLSEIETQDWEQDMRAALEEVAAPVFADYPDVTTRIQVVESHPALALRDLGENADLLILARRRRAFPRGHLGGTARAMLREAPCPVVVVPTDGQCPGYPDGVL